MNLYKKISNICMNKLLFPGIDTETKSYKYPT